jgi:hypothetical protein
VVRFAPGKISVSTQGVGGDVDRGASLVVNMKNPCPNGEVTLDSWLVALLLYSHDL